MTITDRSTTRGGKTAGDDTPTIPAATSMERLRALRALGGSVRTRGLPDAVVERFLALAPDLSIAIERAWSRAEALKEEDPAILAADEASQIETVQDGIVNFYGREVVSPYLALGAAGPWVVTAKGAVVHDSGGYGMLGFGHAPEALLRALARPQVMANVMTPSVSQRRAIRALRAEIGHRRTDGCPYSGFLFMNSGSESVAVAARIADVNAKLRTDPAGPDAGRPIRRLALRGGFHGRTQRPGQFSDSTMRVYRENLASFRDLDQTLLVEPNDAKGLRRVFEETGKKGEFIEAFFMEPVMGEGNPGQAVTREFYDVARALTLEHGSLLLTDSIQAGLRAHGVLSIVDYPGFEDAEAPDLETYSKALNAGQYPMSVLAMTDRAASLYRTGIYGNTMTTAPRALEIAVAVLQSVTPDLRRNIVERGREFREMLQRLAAEKEIDGAITEVQGTGLLVACFLDPRRYRSQGAGSTEEYLRTRGFGVIHGGGNALRYTPHFHVTTDELRLMVDAIRDALRHGPRVD